MLGANYDNHTNPPTGTYKQMSTGLWHSCAIDTAGLVQCWGHNNYDSLVEPSGTYKQISNSNYHNCALRTNNTVSRWGRLGALLSHRKLHFPPLSSSPRIPGFLPSSFIPQAPQSTHPFLMFGPSLRDGSGTVASADPCGLNPTSRSGLPLGLAPGLPR